VDGLPLTPPSINAPPPANMPTVMGGVAGSKSLCTTGLVIVRAPGQGVPPSATGCDKAVHIDRLRETFDDEFDTLRLYDPQTKQGVWKTLFAHGPQTGPNAWDSRTLRGNKELEIYVDPAFPGLGQTPLGLNPFSVRNGMLTITADRTPEALKWKLWGYNYISGVLTTQLSFAQRYGYFEIRAKLPSGKGVWPAFWLLATDATWPPELDILEQLGGEDVYQTVHTAQDGANEESGYKTAIPGDTTGFHTYGALWTPDRIVWFVDGKQTATAPTPADMHKPMYVLLNLAVGGGMPGDPDGRTPFPARYTMDYLRIYALDPTPARPK
jgi:hypothetical protein